MDMKLAKPGKTTPQDLVRMAQVSAEMLEQIRNTMLEPFPRKVAPPIPSTRVQEICGIDKKRMNYVLNKDELPRGQQERPGAPRYFTVEEAQAWIRAELKPTPRKGPGKVIAVANFKGGVTKTTMSTVLAQGLSLRRGRKVLHIDLDPQGSATVLYGINPHAEVTPEQTIMPLVEAYAQGVPADIRNLPQETYWPNLHLIPSCTDLFTAEFMLPARAANSGRGEDAHFERVLNDGLEQLKDEYDYIILDTAPTLSYLTVNAIYAADGVIVPVVPDMLSFSSMVQFWTLFSDLVRGMEEQGKEFAKTFDFIDVLITRMSQKEPAIAVQEWIRQVYGSRLLPIAIPETELAKSSTWRFATIYDIPSSEVDPETNKRIRVNADTMRRARVPCDQFVDHIDDKVSSLWQ